MSKYKVTATSLNIRSEPKIVSTNRIAVLPNGHLVDLVNMDRDPWWLVETVLHAIRIRGYVHANYLVAVADFFPPNTLSLISPVHLKENRTTITRKRDGGRAYPLGEPGRPRRDGTTSSERITQLTRIIDWLAVDQNERYLRKGSTTYCNIYAYDYCYLAGVYIPRVWWKEKALTEISRGNPVDVLYGETVRELNANSLHDWFDDFGLDFGWRSSVDPTECQQAANEGKVVIACAKRVTTNRPGHICALVPENTQYQAKRKSDGEITKPLQSQAGSSNFRYKAAGKWWTADRFQSFGLWIHD